MRVLREKERGQEAPSGLAGLFLLPGGNDQLLMRCESLVWGEFLFAMERARATAVESAKDAVCGAALRRVFVRALWRGWAGGRT
jgi:hypothetical protein